MKHALLIVCIMTFSSWVQLHGQSVSDLLPGSVEGWTPREPDKIYTPQTLYDYIDGGAELYLSYGMKEVVSRILIQSENEIRIEIFDMGEARNAFGVFTHTRTHDELQYGQGSQYFTGAQIFWKNKFFVAVTANDENESIVLAIQYIASQIENKIATTGSIPGILGLLPVKGMEPDGYLYFYHYIWLNSYYFISGDNILDLRSDTEAVLAKYGPKDSRYFLLIVRYPDAFTASKAGAEFREHFLEAENEVMKIEDGSWLGGRVVKEYFLAVFNAGSKNAVTDLMDDTELEITKP